VIWVKGKRRKRKKKRTKRRVAKRFRGKWQNERENERSKKRKRRVSTGLLPAVPCPSLLLYNSRSVPLSPPI